MLFRSHAANVAVDVALRVAHLSVGQQEDFGGVFLAVANETNFRKDIVATVKSNFGKHLPVMDTVIPATVRQAEVSTADKSIFQREPRGRAAEAYRSPTKEVLKAGEKQRSRTSDLGR